MYDDQYNFYFKLRRINPLRSAAIALCGQMSEIEKLRNINRPKIYRGAPRLAARELVRDKVFLWYNGNEKNQHFEMC